MQWNLLITGSSILLIVFLILKEAGRPDRSFLALRLVASVLAVACLAAMAFPLSYKVTGPAPLQGPLVLITAGAEPDSVDKFIGRQNLPVYATDPVLAERLKRSGAKLIGGTDYLAATFPGRDVEIFGFGLEPFDLEPLSGNPVRLHAPGDPQGVSSVHWPMNLTQGATFRMQGFYHNRSPQPVRLVLKAFGITLDSVMLGTGRSPFELTAVPRQLGRSVLSLICLSGRDTISRDPVPVTIEAPKALKILLLSGAPAFEFKFLKNWLTSEGYAIAVRTRISRNKFDFRYINTRRISLDRITAGTLSGFDVVIGDHAELEALSRENPGILASAVQRNGLGLVVLTDSVLKGGFYARHFPVRPVTGPGPSGLIRLTGDPDKSFSLDEPSRFVILPARGTRPVLTGKANSALVSSRLFGKGYVVTTTLQDTYSLTLQGQTGSYGELWSAILSAAGPEERAPEQVIRPFFPRVGEPAELEISSPSGDIPRITVGGTTLAPEQHPNLYDRWRSVYWPEKAGWTMVESTGSQPGSVFIYGPDDWQGVRYHQRLEQTRKAASVAGRKQPAEQSPVVTKKPFPRIWPFMIFLICCGFLWYETKILSRGYYAGRKNM
ncbi:MAG TPA: hypothetical protein VGD92_05550 [Sphingobacteriaceae bacterium]